MLLVAFLAACTTPAETEPPSPSDTDDTPETDDTGGADTDDTGGADTDDTSGEGTEPPRTLSSGEHTLEHEGLSRLFRLYLPADLPAGAPLVVTLHGYGGSAGGIQGYSGLDAQADEHGFAVVYPQAMVDTWGWRCWDVGYCSYAEGELDDVGFVREVIELVRADQGLDSVLVTGMSNGGDMTYRMACHASDIVDVTAPVAGCLMGWLADDCAPATPPPMLHIHGNADNITLWDGDPTYKAGGYYSTLDSIGFVAGLHETTDYTTETDGDIIVHSWATAAESVPVQLYEIDGGRHDWPSGDELDAASLMWSFFVEQTQ